MGKTIKEKEKSLAKQESKIAALESQTQKLEASLHKAESAVLRAQGEGLAAEQEAKAHLSKLRLAEDQLSQQANQPVIAPSAVPPSAAGSSPQDGAVADASQQNSISPDASNEPVRPSEVQRLNRVIAQLQGEKEVLKTKTEGEIRALRHAKLRKIVELEQELALIGESWESDKHQFQITLQIEKERMNRSIDSKHQDLQAAEARAMAAQAELSDKAAQLEVLQAEVQELESTAQANELVRSLLSSLQCSKHCCRPNLTLINFLAGSTSSC